MLRVAVERRVRGREALGKMGSYRQKGMRRAANPLASVLICFHVMKANVVSPSLLKVIFRFGKNWGAKWSEEEMPNGEWTGDCRKAGWCGQGGKEKSGKN